MWVCVGSVQNGRSEPRCEQRPAEAMGRIWLIVFWLFWYYILNIWYIFNILYIKYLIFWFLIVKSEFCWVNSIRKWISWRYGLTRGRGHLDGSTCGGRNPFEVRGNVVIWTEVFAGLLWDGSQRFLSDILLRDHRELCGYFFMSACTGILRRTQWLLCCLFTWCRSAPTPLYPPQKSSQATLNWDFLFSAESADSSRQLWAPSDFTESLPKSLFWEGKSGNLWGAFIVDLSWPFIPSFVCAGSVPRSLRGCLGEREHCRLKNSLGFAMIVRWKCEFCILHVL